MLKIFNLTCFLIRKIYKVNLNLTLRIKSIYPFSPHKSEATNYSTYKTSMILTKAPSLL
jgi:hypothetical protein